jgi:pilus assembly protein CpaC
VFGSRLRAVLACIALSARAHAAPVASTPVPQSVAGAPVAADVRLAVGAQHVLSAAGVQSYSEGVAGICDVRLTRDAGQFVLVGLRPGETTLLLLMRDGTEQYHRIQVFDPVAPVAEEASQKPSVIQRENIRLDFYFVQLNRSYSHQVGVGWPASIGAGASAGASFDLLQQRFNSATAVVTDQALPRLDMAQASGWAKVLRQAAIVTANGSRATFAGGGEVNIPIAGSLAAEIRAITFGSTISVAPRYDDETGRIEVGLSADVADLVDDNGTGAPGRLTSSLETVVNLELGQSIVLAGLSSHRATRQRSGIPVLSAIPVLGALFGSHGATEQASENAIIIVPTVVEVVSPEARDRIREALRAFEAFDGDLGAVQAVWERGGRGPR